MASKAQQFRALLWKSLLMQRRNMRFWIFALVAPVLMTVLVGVLVSSLNMLGTEATAVTPALVPRDQPLPVLAGDGTLKTAADLVNRVFRPHTPEVDQFPRYRAMEWANYTRLMLHHGGPDFCGGLNVSGMPDATHAGDVRVSLRVMYNASVSDTLPVMLKTVGEALFNYFASPDALASFEVTESPFEDDSKSKAFAFMLFGPLIITYAIGFLGVSYAQRVVEERQLGVVQLLQMHGVGLPVLWLSYLLAHAITFMIPAVLSVSILCAFQVGAIVDNSLLATVLLFASSGPALISQAYVLSLLFDDAETCARWLRQFTSWIIVIPYLVVTVILSNPNILWMQYMLCVFPTYGLYRGLTLLGLWSYIGQPLTTAQVFDPHNQVIVVVLIMLGTTALNLGVLAVAEWLRSHARGITHSLSPAQTEGDLADNDVAAEWDAIDAMARMGHTSDDNTLLLLHDLTKDFPATGGDAGTRVVSHLSLRLHQGELFGLLGPNGSGKSTTARMITGALWPSHGSIWINGAPAGTATTQIGVCPQHDALWSELTGIEHIMLHAMVKGTPVADLRATAETLAATVGLGEHAGRRAGTYSGGTKRKLSLALAFAGDPKIVILDEPSTGLDARARRHMWDALESLKAGRAIMLISHSMEEVEALADRVGMLVKGRMIALGSVLHLREKFSRGWRAVAVTQPEDAPRVVQAMTAWAPGTEVVSEFLGTLVFRVPAEEMSLARLFRHMQSLDLDSYHVSQTTLQQVFVALCREQQRHDEGDPASASAPPASLPSLPSHASYTSIQ